MFPEVYRVQNVDTQTLTHASTLTDVHIHARGGREVLEIGIAMSVCLDFVQMMSYEHFDFL